MQVICRRIVRLLTDPLIILLSIVTLVCTVIFIITLFTSSNDDNSDIPHLEGTYKLDFSTDNLKHLPDISTNLNLSSITTEAFTVNMKAEKIRAFYETELSKKGWSLISNDTSGLYLHKRTEAIAIYTVQCNDEECINSILKTIPHFKNAIKVGDTILFLLKGAYLDIEPLIGKYD